MESNPELNEQGMPHFDVEQLRRIACIGDSYAKLTGRTLLQANGDFAAALWAAPFAIVAHGTEQDPIFYFGNRVALKLFELDFNAFIRLPSRLSAEPRLRDERASFLRRVSQIGIIDDYSGVRISATGKRFHIFDGSVWNLTDGAGKAVGQAAAFWPPAESPK
jgi:hypothetical protein